MEDIEDYELKEEQKTYPQYDDMNYDDLSSNFDELTSRLNREVKYNSDPLAATDLNNELSYVKHPMEERGTAQTTFTEGTVNISGPSGSTSVPSVDLWKTQTIYFQMCQMHSTIHLTLTGET